MQSEPFDLGEQLFKDDEASRLHDPIDNRETVKLNISTVEDIFNYPDPEYLLEPIIHKNTLTLLTAYAGAGKSLVSLSMAHALITGEPLWSHFDVSEKGPVLIVDEENPGSLLKVRLSQMGFTKDMPIYFLHYQSVKVDNNDIFSELLKVIKEKEPILVIFDALIRLHDCGENEASEMRNVMGAFRKLLNETNTTIIIIHHDRKGQGDHKQLARGSSDIVGAVDHQLCLSQKEDSTLTISPGKTRMEPFKPIKLRINSDNDQLSFVYLGREANDYEAIIDAIVEILSSNKDEDLGIKEIHQHLNQGDFTIGVNKVRDFLKTTTDERIKKDTGTNGKHIYSLNSSFTGSRGIYSPVNREAEPTKDGQLSGFTHETPLNSEIEGEPEDLQEVLL